MTPAQTGLAAEGPSARKLRLAADGTVSGEPQDLSLYLIGWRFTFPSHHPGNRTVVIYNIRICDLTRHKGMDS